MSEPMMTLIAMRDGSVVSVRDELDALIASATHHPEITVQKRNDLMATLTGPRSVVQSFADSFERALIFEEDKKLTAIAPPGPFEGDRVEPSGSDEAIRFSEDDEVNEI
ncbi:hypothetical protein [Nereida sp. MMG025]|uniref:hypothetical protein n=1 Tax=Nereida sp. MMG025 TaxID=2909981 RepID=UPI001F435082|nr:hypothetical protein [Nereida sp. MMG025]MCF6445775.1 hypothetical protein [Nereida sp. MMG025]